jgi:chromosome segregation ATPase
VEGEERLTCASIPHQPEELNAKGEEMGALRVELKEVVQELLWRDANITTLDHRAALAEARAADLEAELKASQADKARAVDAVSQATPTRAEVFLFGWL